MVDFTNIFSDLGNNFSRGFANLQQYAKDIMSNGNERVPLPQEYVKLYQKTLVLSDVLKNINYIKDRYSASTYSTDFHALQNIGEFATNLQAQAQTLATSGARAIGISNSFKSPTSAPKIPNSDEVVTKTFSQELSKTASRAMTLDEDSTESSKTYRALRNFSHIESIMGSQEIAFKESLIDNEIKSAYNSITEKFTRIANHHKQVAQLRSNYASHLEKCKPASTRPSSAAVRPVADADLNELEEIRKAYEDCCTTGCNMMSEVEDCNEIARFVHILASLQLSYHKKSYEAIAEAIPELDEIFYS